MSVKGYSTLPRSPELDHQHQIQFNAPPHPFGWVLHLCRKYSQCTLSTTDRAIISEKLKQMIYNKYMKERKIF